MTTSGGERFNFIIGMEFRPGDAVQEALRTGTSIRNVVERVLNQPLTLGALANPDSMIRQAEQIGAQLRAALNTQQEQRVAQAGNTGGLSRNAEIALSGVVSTGGTAGLAERARLAAALLKADAATLDTSTKEGEARKAVLQATVKELQTLAGIETAERAVERSLQGEAATVARGVQVQKKAVDDHYNREGRLQREAERREGEQVRQVTQARAAFEAEMQARGRIELEARRRAGVEQKLAEQEAESLRAQGLVASYKPAFPGATADTQLGAAQASVNRAERHLAEVLDADATLRAKGTYTYPELSRSEQRVIDANNALAAARRRESVEAIKAAPAPPVGNFAQQFQLGFKGETNRPYGEQLGQAFKFSLFYGTAYKLLFAFTQTMQATLQEGIAFQQAMTELKIAAGEGAQNLDDIARSTGDVATQYGAAPSEGVLVGARSLGLFGATGATGATPADQQRIADISARVASQVALNSGQKPTDVEPMIAAVTQAFGLSAQGQIRVADLDAYFSHQFGITPGQTIQAVAESGTVGKAAGFSQEEVTAIAADIMSRQAQTPSAVAGYMAQFFSRGGEGALTQLTSKYGIDKDADLRTQFIQLAEIYRNATSDQQTEIAAAGGRGKAQSAFIGFLNDLPTILDLADRSKTESAGAGQKAAELRLDNIGGQITATIGALKAFASELSQSGILDILGLGLETLRELAEAGTELLRLWNSMGHVTRDVIIALALLAAASRATAVGQALTGLASGRLGVQAIGASAAVGSAIGTTALLASVAAVTIGFNELSKAHREYAEAQKEAANALAESADLSANSSPEEIRAQATADAAASSRNEQAANGFFAKFDDAGLKLFGGQSSADKADITADRLDRESNRLNALADYLEQRDKANPERTALIQGFDADSLSAGLDQITASGGTTRDQLRALADALNETAHGAAAAKAAFDPYAEAAGSAGGIFDALNKGIHVGQDTGGLKDLLGVAIPGLRPDADYSHNVAPDLFAKAGLDPQELQRRALNSFTSRGIKGYDDLQGRNLNNVASDIVGMDAADLGLDPKQTEAARQLMMKIVRQYFRAKRKALEDGLATDRKLTKAEVTEVTNQFLALGQQRTAELPESDLSGRIASDRRTVRRIAQTIRQGDHSNKAQENLEEAQRDLADAQFNRLEALRRIAQRNARSVADVARQGRKFLGPDIRAAVKGGNTDLLVKILGQAGNGALRIAINTINEALEVAQAGVEVHHRVFDEFGRIIGVAKFIEGVDADLVAGLKAMRRAAKAALSGGHAGNLYRTGGDANLPDRLTPDETSAGSGETAADRRVAAAQAAAVRSESPIQQARADILAARVAMSQAKKGTVEYYDALAQYYQARNELTDAILDYRHNLDLLSIDMTDPIAMAQAAVREAARKLRSDRGKGKDVIAADKVALEQAQNEAEATAFQTRLETVQTAESLGRISHQAYIRYLENESRRLNRIKDRTFQQQQELNQIDQLLKDAAGEMDAQFNLGNIKLPTVYQVRRAIEERSGGNVRDIAATQRGASVNSNNTTHIQIDGADFDKVKKLLDKELSKPGRTVTTSSRRRIG